MDASLRWHDGRLVNVTPAQAGVHPAPAHHGTRMDASIRWHDEGEVATSCPTKPPGFPSAAFSAWEPMEKDARLKRLRFRAWHRGTREADMLVGGYFDRWHEAWGEAELGWFEALLEEQDVDIIAWAMGTGAVPVRWQGPMMTRLKTTDYIKHPK